MDLKNQCGMIKMVHIRIFEIKGLICAVDDKFTSINDCERCKHYLGTRVGDKGHEVICRYD